MHIERDPSNLYISLGEHRPPSVLRIYKSLFLFIKTLEAHLNVEKTGKTQGFLVFAAYEYRSS